MNADNISKSVNDGIEATKGLAERSLNKAQEKLNNGVDYATNAAAAAKRRACDCRDTVLDYTTTKPVNALLIAMGVGAVLGHCLLGKKKNKDY